MIKNYLTTAIRNVRRNIVISVISILGLSIGMAYSFLVFLLIQYETSFDTFHKKADYICRVMKQGRNAKNEVVYRTNCGADIGPLCRNEYPEIVNMVRLTHQNGILCSDKEEYYESHLVYFADPSIFDIFSFSLKKSIPYSVDAGSMLSEPNTAVLTSSMAEKYFGKENPIGKTISFQNSLMKSPVILKITGILDPIPDNSHIQFGLLASYETLNSVYVPGYLDDDIKIWTYTFFELSSPSAFQPLQRKLYSHYFPYFQSERFFQKVILEKLNDIYLSSPAPPGPGEKTGNQHYVTLLFISVFFILFISCLNVVNLLTARISGRGKEVSIRKISGAKRSELIIQFIIESLVLSFLSLVGALLLAELALPFFNILVERTLSINYTLNYGFLSVMVLLTFITGLLSGLYPALFLSSCKPIVMSKGKRSRFAKTLRKVLVVTQFVISITLFICSAIVSGESEYLKTKQTGFEREKILIVNMNFPGSKGKYGTFKNRLLKEDTIDSVTVSSFVPWSFDKVNSADIGSADFTGITNAFMIFVDQDFLKTYSIQLLEGNDFSAQDFHLLQSSFLINETAKNAFGWDTALGKRLGIRHQVDGIDVGYGIIKGVIQDFHYFHPFYKVKPLILVFSGQNRMLPREYVSIRIKDGLKEEAIAAVKKVWDTVFPGSLFNCSPLSTILEKEHKSLSSIIDTALKLATAFAIFIACLGLLGLTFYELEQRTHEIGIRKALGADSYEITFILIKNLVVLVIITNIIAWPFSIIIMKGLFYFFNYPFPLRLNPMIFLLSGVGSFILSLVTVSGLTIRASRANPTEVLRYE